MRSSFKKAYFWCNNDIYPLCPLTKNHQCLYLKIPALFTTSSYLEI